MGVATVGSPEDDGQGVFFGRDDDEVDVIGEQAVSQNAEGLGGGIFAELSEVDHAVASAVEDELAAGTALA